MRLNRDVQLILARFSAVFDVSSESSDVVDGGVQVVRIRTTMPIYLSAGFPLDTSLLTCCAIQQTDTLFTSGYKPSFTDTLALQTQSASVKRSRLSKIIFEKTLKRYCSNGYE